MKSHLMDPIFFTPPRDKLNKQLYKGGGDAPSHDPQIGAAALKNAQLGQDAFDFFKQEYINAKPAQEKLNALAAEVQQQLVDSGKINTQYAQDYYNYMTDVFRPLEKSIVDNANNYDTAGRREQEAAQGLSDVTQAFDAQRAKTNRNNERMGVNPNSGNAQAVNAQLDVAEAVAGANAMNKGRKNAEMTGNAMKIDAASLGRNLPSNQATSQQIANSSATGAVNTGLSTMTNDRAQTGLMQSGFNTAMQGYNNQANILQNQYQGQLQGWQAQQQNNAQGWAGLGTLAGMYLMRADGGEISKEELYKQIADRDFTEKFNTELTEDEEAEYSKAYPDKRAIYDYDMKGAWKSGAARGENGHYPDTFKKPNHPTFSNQSLYSNEENEGGSWEDLGNDKWRFTPGKTNMYSPEDLKYYFEKVEPNSELVDNRLPLKNGGAVSPGLESVFSGTGPVSGPGTSTSDSIPAKLSDGEFVINAEAVKMIGLDTLNSINKAGLEKRKGAK